MVKVKYKKAEMTPMGGLDTPYIYLYYYYYYYYY